MRPTSNAFLLGNPWTCFWGIVGQPWELRSVNRHNSSQWANTCQISRCLIKLILNFEWSCASIYVYIPFIYIYMYIDWHDHSKFRKICMKHLEIWHVLLFGIYICKYMYIYNIIIYFCFTMLMLVLEYILDALRGALELI